MSPAAEASYLVLPALVVNLMLQRSHLTVSSLGRRPQETASSDVTPGGLGVLPPAVLVKRMAGLLYDSLLPRSAHGDVAPSPS